MKNDNDIERAVFDAMRFAGWILPQSTEEVLRAERELAEHPVPLPTELANPYAILDRPDRSIPVAGSIGALRDAATELNLAQAAREGSEIPPEVREQMDSDRKRAEEGSDE
jgi:hypothetical protein